MSSQLSQKTGLYLAVDAYYFKHTQNADRVFKKEDLPKGFVEIEDLDERFPKPSHDILRVQMLKNIKHQSMFPDAEKESGRNLIFEKPNRPQMSLFSKAVSMDETLAKEGKVNDYNDSYDDAGKLQRRFRVYVNPESKQIYFAFRGSATPHNFGESMYDGGAYEFQKIAPQAQWVLDSLRQQSAYKDYQIVATGHSMGGGMAQAFGLKNGLDIQVYNSLPLPNDVITDPRFLDGKNYFHAVGGYDKALEEYKNKGKRIDDVVVPGELAQIHYRNRPLNYGVYVSKEMEQPITTLTDTTPYRIFMPFNAKERHSQKTLIQLAELTPEDPKTGKFIPIQGSEHHWKDVSRHHHYLSQLSNEPITAIKEMQVADYEYRTANVYSIERNGKPSQKIETWPESRNLIITQKSEKGGMYKIEPNNGKLVMTYCRGENEFNSPSIRKSLPSVTLINAKDGEHYITPDGKKVTLKEAYQAFKQTIEHGQFKDHGQGKAVSSQNSGGKFDAAPVGSTHQFAMNLLNDIHVNYQGLSTGGIEKSVNYASLKA